MKRILLLVILVITVTTAIQGYWNYKNYISSKQQFSNDIQLSLDTAVNNYFEDLAKKNTLGFAIGDEEQKTFLNENGKFKDILANLNIDNKGFTLIDSLDHKTLEGITILKKELLDSLSDKKTTHHFNLNNENDKTKWISFTDSLKGKQKKSLEFLTSKVVISITNDTLNLKALDTFLKRNLKTKNINIAYGLSYKPNNGELKHINIDFINKNNTNLRTKSLLLDTKDNLQIYFKDETSQILIRILTDIIISIVLILSLITCLLYLLKVINKQKQLAEIKNDLISNITHEFKTPISTISVALESIKDFNLNDESGRTSRYLDISTSQLDKLTIMVEKLLETASLDSNNLKLNKNTIQLNKLVNLLVNKHQLQTNAKSISFNDTNTSICIIADEFHIENAINNIIDNAVKYGGDVIEISLKQDKTETLIIITDNGTSLTKSQSELLFDKFYRVPKGNTHNVKGFGIGLYYTKKIIEKHNGTISVTIANNTTFKITLPNEY